ncbi:MAG: hypothetical protein DRP78_04630 [Candidatus Omnitrophota bacterium]|nr:MAG: hypothetical protein DRP78_04630 [Candidatus Omnitrophota bacterium]
MGKGILIVAAILLVIFSGVFGGGGSVGAQCVDGVDGCLFGWNQDGAEGTNWPGWTWYEEGNSVITSGHPGWVLNEDGPFGGSQNFPWGPSVRTFEKSDYGNDALAIIDTTTHAPSTNTGGVLKVYDSGNSSTFQSCWWAWYDGIPLSERGVTNSSTDRWSFYINLHGIESASATQRGSMFHVGTYVCDYTGLPAYGNGDGCPYEGPGNQHYYHYFRFSPDAWIHVELDQHPQHRRNSFVAGNNPTMITNGFNYMAHLNQWYMEIPYAQNQETYYLLDEMYFYSTQDSAKCAEPNQNDDSVTSVWVGYWPIDDKWQIFWEDQSYETASGENLNDDTQSTFEVKWSVSPITNANYNQATLINPEWFGGPTHTSYPNGIRRNDSWRTDVFTQFELPDEIENNNNQIYFAIKDVSVAGGNAGTNWPYNRTDGHDAASPNIHIIDYHLRPDDSDTTPPTRFSGSPTGEIDAGTTAADISLSTDENATCKYSSMENTDYADMTNFSATTGTNHTTEVTGLENGKTYNYYVKCKDVLENTNPDDYEISFSVANAASASATNKGSGRCFIATAAYGTPLAEEVEILSGFRDNYLLTNYYGRTFVNMYYKYGPKMADYLRQRDWARKLVRLMLRPLVNLIK